MNLTYVPYEDSPMWLGKLSEPVYLRTSDRSEISHLQCSHNRCDALIRGDDPAPLYPIASNMCFSLHFPCLLLDRELHWVVYSHEQTTEASRFCEQHSRRNGACMERTRAAGKPLRHRGREVDYGSLYLCNIEVSRFVWFPKFRVMIWQWDRPASSSASQSATRFSLPPADDLFPDTS
ncbi:hypothetical protein BD311DRAFT_238464 [Dichomitus squalens]|uniref:Uncharacterized protein n=1 Tax=Dichomitus squalens TaxID=114155 RepID=A0A4Q9MR70_9APHY|nr:hypothetical protein BD311DRAFT_238464 [Dichomitus squalens]